MIYERIQIMLVLALFFMLLYFILLVIASILAHMWNVAIYPKIVKPMLEIAERLYYKCTGELDRKIIPYFIVYLIIVRILVDINAIRTWWDKYLDDNWTVECDAANSFGYLIQDPSTPAAEGMIFFHNYLLFFLILIGTVIVWFLLKVVLNSNSNIFLKSFTHSSSLEIGWTILPAILLLFMAVPSFCLLYSLDELSKCTTTLKIIGHQWYWSYEYLDTDGESEPVGFDSYIIDIANEPQTRFGMFRLLETDNRVVLPIKTHIKLLISSADVLHSWAVPSFGIKVDACPGRLSEASLFLKRKGTFYGQCSEICGINHGFMPIVVSGVNFDTYIDWLFAREEINYDELQKISSCLQNFTIFINKIIKK